MSTDHANSLLPLHLSARRPWGPCTHDPSPKPTPPNATAFLPERLRHFRENNVIGGCHRWPKKLHLPAPPPLSVSQPEGLMHHGLFSPCYILLWRWVVLTLSLSLSVFPYQIPISFCLIDLICSCLISSSLFIFFSFVRFILSSLSPPLLSPQSSILLSQSISSHFFHHSLWLTLVSPLCPSSTSPFSLSLHHSIIGTESLSLSPYLCTVARALV